MKITRYQDIPKFTSVGSYEVNMSFKYLVGWIEKEIKEENLQLNPEFQRGHVWNEEQQIKWLEFYLAGGKTANVIYFNNPNWRLDRSDTYTDYVCVDGLQRITAIQRFMNQEIPVYGSYEHEYTDMMRDTNLRVNVNDLTTEYEVLNWYLEMNDSGTPHSKEELVRVRKMIEKAKEDLK